MKISSLALFCVLAAFSCKTSSPSSALKENLGQQRVLLEIGRGYHVADDSWRDKCLELSSSNIEYFAPISAETGKYSGVKLYDEIFDFNSIYTSGRSLDQLTPTEEFVVNAHSQLRTGDTLSLVYSRRDGMSVLKANEYRLTNSARMKIADIQKRNSRLSWKDALFEICGTHVVTGVKLGSYLNRQLKVEFPSDIEKAAYEALLRSEKRRLKDSNGDPYLPYLNALKNVRFAQLKTETLTLDGSESSPKRSSCSIFNPLEGPWAVDKNKLSQCFDLLRQYENDLINMSKINSEAKASANDYAYQPTLLPIVNYLSPEEGPIPENTDILPPNGEAMIIRRGIMDVLSERNELLILLQQPSLLPEHKEEVKRRLSETEKSLTKRQKLFEACVGPQKSNTECQQGIEQNLTVFSKGTNASSLDFSNDVTYRKLCPLIQGFLCLDNSDSERRKSCEILWVDVINKEAVKELSSDLDLWQFLEEFREVTHRLVSSTDPEIVSILLPWLKGSKASFHFSNDLSADPTNLSASDLNCSLLSKAATKLKDFKSKELNTKLYLQTAP